MTRLLTAKQVEEEYGIKKRFLEQLRGRGEGPEFHRLSEQSITAPIMYDRKDLDSWLKQTKQNPAREILRVG